MKLALPPYIIALLFFSFQPGFAFNTLTETGTVQRVRISFTSPSGNFRPLLLGFTTDDAATDGVDFGYDAETRDNYPNDLNWIIEDNRYVIQGVGHYDPAKFYELGLYLAETGNVTIALTALENFDTEIPVYLYDALYDDYTQINGSPFIRFVNPGTYLNRFFLAFSTEDVVLSTSEEWFKESLKISYQNNEIKFQLKSGHDVQNFTIHQIDGKQIYRNISRNNNISLSAENLKNIPLLVSISTQGKYYTRTILIPD